MKRPKPEEYAERMEAALKLSNRCPIKAFELASAILRDFICWNAFDGAPRLLERYDAISERYMSRKGSKR